MQWKEGVRLALDGNHPVIGRSVAIALQVFIVSSTVSIGVETLPNLPAWTKTFFPIEEALIVAVFTVEYILRILSADRRLAYVTSFWGIVDLVAILPFYLMIGLDFRAARALRLLRVLRVLKLGRYSAAAERMGQALRSTFEELAVFGFAAVVILYLCSILIYYFEHAAQPEAFSSVFASMWWAAITLTTVGYGDVYPITTGGRIFTVVMLIVALGIIAVPTGIVASALSTLRAHEEEKKD
jgi:voltage-gated potassium channel